MGPALGVTRSGPNVALKRDSQAVLGRSAGGVLVIAQTALCLLLLIGAGLFVRTFLNLTNQKLGFDTHDLYTASIDPRVAGFKGPRLAQFYSDLYSALNASPGVAASFSTDAPIAGCCWSQSFLTDGQADDPGKRTTAFFNMVSPGFFRTFQTRILAGRDFTLRDASSTPFAIVNRALAEQFFPGADPLGKHIVIGKNAARRSLEIVGVVDDMRTGGLRAGTEYEIYMNMFQSAELVQMIVEVRSPRGLAETVALLRQQTRALNARIPLVADSFGEQVARTVLSDRMTAILAAFFGALALLLACVGLYGILSYNVVRRTSEIGMRMALGAQASSVIRMIVREALLFAGAGAAIGIPAALVCSRWMVSLSTLLFGIRPTDPWNIAAMTMLLLVLAALAGYLPACRAARIDPVKALREE